MKEQLRTEAEKRNLVYAKNINNEYNITGLIDISKNPPKIYCFCTEEIAKEILDFHAQQSKERDVIGVLIKSKTALEYCRNNGLSVLFCDETIHEIDVFLTENK